MAQFTIHEDKLRQNLELVADVAAAADVTIILALKAFAYWPAFPIFAEYLTGATASSLNEAKLIERHFGKKPHVYAPVYRPHEFAEVAALAGHLTFNSLTELERYRSTWEKLGTNVGLRVNPEYSPVETELYNPANPHGRLGETLPNLPAKPPKGLRGLHVHTLCESTASNTATLIERVKAQFGHYLEQIEWLNLGGGHLMTKEGYDVDALITALRQLRQRYPHLQVILEPGSAMAWGTGTLDATVLDIVENYGSRTLMLDVSFTCHMPDTLEMPYRPELRGVSSKENPAFPYPYRLGGMSCLAGDYLDTYHFRQPVRVGDRVIFEDMAHYTTVKTTMFNGVPHPDIRLIDADGEEIASRHFSYEDYEARMG
ncbi:carboxynorspermidine decarboxylase [Neolewinella lacunae]|uniref:Carboxynorspermidine/carboxyspermidine decarboxylase n=1 Tax=Neolewinella lacunae TaxID=1517758 RepID=A0A923PIF4_9BACT|nr:carboxynorspermidine decarboxylase [Neolewinella lacunae]MBC6993869.1 carboxynorspermidine decarboxylase [Neolewinella lacunae]MDN3637070.1 carboxynorspermidine decarboxylase [Neolewinella lacunae]